MNPQSCTPMQRLGVALSSQGMQTAPISHPHPAEASPHRTEAEGESKMEKNPTYRVFVLDRDSSTSPSPLGGFTTFRGNTELPGSQI